MFEFLLNLLENILLVNKKINKNIVLFLWETYMRIRVNDFLFYFINSLFIIKINILLNYTIFFLYLIHMENKLIK